MPPHHPAVKVARRVAVVVFWVAVAAGWVAFLVVAAAMLAAGPIR